MASAKDRRHRAVRIRAIGRGPAAALSVTIKKGTTTLRSLKLHHLGTLPAWMLLLALAASGAASAQPTGADLASAQQEKALALLASGSADGDPRQLQAALLLALEAEAVGPDGLDARALARLGVGPFAEAFALRWRSPGLWLGGPVTDLAWLPGAGLLASAGGDGRVRLWDPASGAPRGQIAANASPSPPTVPGSPLMPATGCASGT
jgi:WD40 repeat protein